MAGRYLVISDIHANRFALESVINDVAAHASDIDGCWCLGDVVGYGPHPAECLRLLRDELTPSVWMLGNHDAVLIHAIHTSPGWASEALDAIELNQRILELEENKEVWEWASRKFAHECPIEPYCFTEGEVSYFAVHGTIDKPLHGYLMWLKSESKVEELTASYQFRHLRDLYLGGGIAGPRRLLVGQTHMPTFLRALKEEPDGDEEYKGEFKQIPIDFNVGPQELGDLPVIINPGSVGQPRDRDNRAAYMILDTQADTVEFRRVAYDVHQTQNDMMRYRYRFPGMLIERLAQGM